MFPPTHEITRIRWGSFPPLLTDLEGEIRWSVPSTSCLNMVQAECLLGWGGFTLRWCLLTDVLSEAVGRRALPCSPSLHQLLRLSRKGGGHCPDPPVTGSQSSHGALGFTGMQIKCSNIQDFLNSPRRIFKNSFYFEVNFGFKQYGESITNPKLSSNPWNIISQILKLKPGMMSGFMYVYFSNYLLSGSYFLI